MIAKLLLKEMKLTASPLSYIFTAFAAMTMIPGYPILCGAFFVCLGIFYTYQQMRECDDITYTVLLPVRKKDVVTAKYLFAVLIELFSFAVCAALTAVRMTVLSGAAVYVNNPLMNANLAYLGLLLLVFAMFNIFFLGGFFRTAYQIGLPFVTFCAAAFLIVFMGEAIHHVPGLEYINKTAGISAIQLTILIAGAAVFAAGTLLSHRTAAARFEKINL